MTTKQLTALALFIAVGTAQAGEKEELLKLRNTTANLINELVKQGVLSEKVAQDMIKRAETDAETQVAEQAAKPESQKPEPGEVRVPYVPKFVKDEIRQQVRMELREEVVGDVMQKAKAEKWGTPDALPEWVNRIKISGDMRLRSQNDFMANDNITRQDLINNSTLYRNYQAINNAGGFFQTPFQNQFLNTDKDRQRFRERLRLAIDAKITDSVKAGIRLATGNFPDPVSTNQSLGNNGAQYQFNLDRAYLQYDAVDDEGFKWFTIAGGRIANPWYVGGGEFSAGSEMVWDTDLSFEGFAATTRKSLGSSSNQPNKHDKSRQVYATVGGFPLDETQLSAGAKWLVGGQVGLDWGFNNQDALKVGVAYYDYLNIRARPNTGQSFGNCFANTPESNLSVPGFLQSGNSLTEICNNNLLDKNGIPVTGSAHQPGLFGLASDFNIINANLSYDMARFAPYHVIFGADFAKNVGFDVKNLPVDNNYQTDLPSGQRPTKVRDETNAWQVRVDFGWPKVDNSGEWNVFTQYKYVERDAVLDGFTDSDFHLGGTNAKGWVIGTNYGLMKNVWFTGRWLSTDVITGPKFGIDTLQLDLNAKF